MPVMVTALDTIYQLSASPAKSSGPYHLLWLRTLCYAVCCCM